MSPEQFNGPVNVLAHLLFEQWLTVQRSVFSRMACSNTHTGALASRSEVNLVHWMKVDVRFQRSRKTEKGRSATVDDQAENGQQQP